MDAFVQEVTIQGSKPVDNEFDGKKFDSTKIWIQTSFKSDVGCGSSTAEYTWGDHTNFEKIKNIPHPFRAKVTMEIVTTGSRTVTIVHDVQPIMTKPDQKIA